MKNLLISVTILFIFSSSKAQCLVNYKEALSNIRGTYLMHRELDNKKANEMSIILNRGKYEVYLLKASHEISKYNLSFESKTQPFHLTLDEETEQRRKFLISLDKTMEYKFSLTVDTEEKACVLLAIYFSDDKNSEIEKFAKMKSPPGTVRISENLFIDKTEIRNIDWKEYLQWIKELYGERSDEYKSSLPDTSVWVLHGKMGKPLGVFYFSHPAFDNFPVVGISYEQAKAYCSWRTDKTNESLFIKKKDKEYKSNKIPDNIPKVYQYRLPTKDEWEKVARIDISEKTKSKIARSGSLNHNLKYEKSIDGFAYTAPVMSYFPNKIGVFNIIGNVAEMIDEKGIAKGGSWNNTEDEVTIVKNYYYNNPESWIGFRCICEKVNDK